MGFCWTFHTIEANKTETCYLDHITESQNILNRRIIESNTLWMAHTGLKPCHYQHHFLTSWANLSFILGLDSVLFDWCIYEGKIPNSCFFRKLFRFWDCSWGKYLLNVIIASFILHLLCTEIKFPGRCTNPNLKHWQAWEGVMAECYSQDYSKCIGFWMLHKCRSAADKLRVKLWSQLCYHCQKENLLLTSQASSELWRPAPSCHG